MSQQPLDPASLMGLSRYASKKSATISDVLNACQAGLLPYIKIDGQTFVIDNEKSQKWENSAIDDSISIEEKNGIIIFTIRNSIILENKMNFENKLMKYINNQIFHFIFQLENDPHLDSSGIAVVTRAALYAVANKSKIQMLNVGPSVRTSFKLSKLEKVIDFPNSLEEALNNLS